MKYTAFLVTVTQSAFCLFQVLAVFLIFDTSQSLISGYIDCCCYHVTLQHIPLQLWSKQHSSIKSSALLNKLCYLCPLNKMLLLPDYICLFTSLYLTPLLIPVCLRTLLERTFKHIRVYFVKLTSLLSFHIKTHTHTILIYPLL